MTASSFKSTSKKAVSAVLLGAASICVSTTALAAFSGSSIEAEAYSAMRGVKVDNGVVGYMDGGDYLRYDQVNFGGVVNVFEADIAVDPQYAGQKIEIRLDAVDGERIGTLVVQSTGSWDNRTTQSVTLSKPVSGVRNIYLVMNGQYGIGNLDRFRFKLMAGAPQTGSRNALNEIEAESFDAQNGATPDGKGAVGYLDSGDYLQFNNVDFGTGVNRFEAVVAVPDTEAGKKIEVFIDAIAGGTKVGELVVGSTGGWSQFQRQVVAIQTVSGTRNLFLRMSGGYGVANLDKIRFNNGGAVTPPPAAKPNPPVATGGGAIPRPGSLKNLSPSGPVTLQSNRTYSGLRVTNPNGSCFVGNNVTNVRITNSEIGPCGNGSSPDHMGVAIFDSSNVRVDHNIIHEAATGFDAVRSTGVVFSHNYVYGIRGPFPSGQIVQYERVSGAGNKVICNIGANTANDRMEDSINLWMSSGTPQSYIEIAYNRVGGGHSKTGSGIILGDGEGAAYLDAHDNTIVNANNAGIAVAGGTNMKMRNNRVYNNSTYTSVGLAVRNFYSKCHTVEITGNRVFGYDRVWGMNGPWHFLNTGECSGITNSGNVFGDTSLSPAIFNEEYPQCN